MSQIPTPGMPRDNTLDYESPHPRNSGRAILSMVLGIIAIPLVFANGFGVLLGIGALLLGWFALESIKEHADELEGKGFALVGIWTGASCLLLLVVAVVLAATSERSRSPSNRSLCAANVRGIMQAVVVYAADNSDVFPIVSPTGGYGLSAVGNGVQNVDSNVTMHSLYTGPAAPSVTQNMWLLVLNGSVAPKQFVCKFDPSYGTFASLTDASNKCFTNFNDGKAASDFAYSYSFAYPWTAAEGKSADGTVIPAGSVGGWWKNTMDAGLPLMADMGPLAGTGKPPATPGDGRSRNGNSFNHQRDGQNVAYGDAHSEFVRLPSAGQKNDNIYAGSGGTPGETGTPPTGTVPNIGAGGTTAAWDVCLVPAADGNAGYKRK